LGADTNEDRGGWPTDRTGESFDHISPAKERSATETASLSHLMPNSFRLKLPASTPDFALRLSARDHNLARKFNNTVNRIGWCFRATYLSPIPAFRTFGTSAVQHCVGGRSTARRSPRRSKAGHTRNLLMRHGIEFPDITEAGIGSFEFEVASGVYTDYGRNLDRDGTPTKAFEPSLFVWATVMSRPTEDRAIVDAGLEALAFDSGRPSSATSPPPPTSAPPTSTAASAFRAPPTVSGSATRSA
jgi:Putative serine dehydratase domain